MITQKKEWIEWVKKKRSRDKWQCKTKNCRINENGIESFRTSRIVASVLIAPTNADFYWQFVLLDEALIIELFDGTRSNDDLFLSAYLIAVVFGTSCVVLWAFGWLERSVYTTFLVKSLTLIANDRFDLNE